MVYLNLIRLGSKTAPIKKGFFLVRTEAVRPDCACERFLSALPVSGAAEETERAPAR